MIFAMSFLERGPYGGYEFAMTFENYVRCFQWIYAKVLVKTVWLALTATLLCLLIGFPVAYYLAKSTGWVRQMGLVLLFIPFWTNFILRIYGIVSLAGNHGLLNQVLLGLGVIDEPLAILYTRTGVYL